MVALQVAVPLQRRRDPRVKGLRRRFQLEVGSNYPLEDLCPLVGTRELNRQDINPTVPSIHTLSNQVLFEDVLSCRDCRAVSTLLRLWA